MKLRFACVLLALTLCACPGPTTNPPPAAPRVLATVPAADATEVLTTTAVWADFDVELDPASLTPSTFTLGGVEGAVAWDAAQKRVTLTPTQPLEPGRTYVATLAPTVRSATGVELGAPWAWGFSTSRRVALASTVPADGATDVAVNASISATFTGPLDETSLSPTSFEVEGATGSVAWSAATHTATFTPSAPLQRGRTYVVRLNGLVDAAQNALPPHVFAFTTSADAEAPSVTSTSPAAEAVDVSPTAVVSATFSEPMNPADFGAGGFTLTSPTGAVAGSVAYQPSTRTATFAPALPLPLGTRLTATLAANVSDLAGNPLGAAFTWAFTVARDTTAPAVLSTAPADGASGVAPTAAIWARFSEPMEPSTLAGAFGVTGTAGTVTWDAASLTATFTPAAPLAPGTSFTATLSTGATDLAGNALLAPVSWQFQTQQNAPPFVAAVSPAPGSTGVPTTAAVTAQFTEALDPATVNGTTFTLAIGASPVAGAVTWSAASNTATFTPAAELPVSTTLTATLTTGLTDLDGAALPLQSTWTFTTAPDTTAPTVVSTLPVSGATGVGVSSFVEATFSEPLDPSTVNGTNFTLSGPSGAVSASVSWSPGTRTARLTPFAALAPGAAYTARLGTGLRDLANNPLAAQVDWPFTTAADTTPPTVLAVAPLDGATGVAADATVTVTFSEPMNPATLTTGAVTMTGGTLTGVFYSAGPRQLTLQTLPFSSGATVSITLSTAMQDANGNGLAAPYSWSFTVFADTTAPTVVATTPIAQGRLVGPQQPVRVQFSEPMNPSTLTAATFTLSPAVAGAVSYDSATNSAIFTPTAGLPAGTELTATVTTGATDTAGNPLAAPLSFTFTVAGTPMQVSDTLEAERLYPQVAFNAAGDGLAMWNVWNGRHLLVAWSTYSASSGTWSADQLLYDYTQFSAPQATVRAIVASGSLFAAQVSNGSAFVTRVLSAGSWSAAGPDGSVAPIAGGFLVVSCTSTTATSSVYAGGAWSAAATVDVGVAGCAAASSAGVAGAITLHNSGTRTVNFRSWSGSAWSAPTVLFTAAEGTLSGAAMRGNATGYAASWQHFTTVATLTPYTQYARVSTGTAFGAETVVRLGTGVLTVRAFEASNGSYAMVLGENTGSFYACALDSGTWTSVTLGASSASTPVALATDGTTFAALIGASSGPLAAVWSAPTWATTALSAIGTSELALASTGSAYVALYQTAPLALAARVWTGGAWAAATTLETFGGTSHAPVAARRGTSVVAAWVSDGRTAIRTASYTSAWSANTNIGSVPRPGAARNLRRARAGTRVVAVWDQSLGLAAQSNSVTPRAAVFDAGTGLWSAPISLTTGAGTVLDLASDGTRVAVMYLASSPSFATAVRTLDTSTGVWSAQAALGGYGNYGGNITVANGQFLAVWTDNMSTSWWSASTGGASWPARTALGSYALQPMLLGVGVNAVLMFRVGPTINMRWWSGSAWTAALALSATLDSSCFALGPSCIAGATNGTDVAVAWKASTSTIGTGFVSSGVFTASASFNASGTPQLVSDGAGYGVGSGTTFRRYSSGTWASPVGLSSVVAGPIASTATDVYVLPSASGPSAHTATTAATGNGGDVDPAGPSGVTSAQAISSPIAGHYLLLWTSSNATTGADEVWAVVRG